MGIFVFRFGCLGLCIKMREKTVATKRRINQLVSHCWLPVEVLYHIKVIERSRKGQIDGKTGWQESGYRGATTTIEDFNKNKFENYICNERNDKNDFLNFKPLFEMLDDKLGNQGQNNENAI